MQGTTIQNLTCVAL